MGELLFALVLLVGSGYLYFSKSAISGITGRSVGIGPEFWPKLLLLVLIGLSAWLLVITIAERRRSATREQSGQEGTQTVLGVAATLVAYSFLLPRLGFLLATPFFVGGIYRLLGGRRHLVTTALSSVVATVIVAMVFGQLVSMPLPRGGGTMAALSRFLY